MCSGTLLNPLRNQLHHFRAEHRLLRSECCCDELRFRRVLRSRSLYPRLGANRTVIMQNDIRQHWRAVIGLFASIAVGVGGEVDPPSLVGDGEVRGLGRGAKQVLGYPYMGC